MGLDYVLTEDCKVELLTFEDNEGKIALRHSASHVLAQAVKRLYKNVKFAIGPAIENGFYYDFETEEPFYDRGFRKNSKRDGKDY